jgi:hypothetical protein
METDTGNALRDLEASLERLTAVAVARIVTDGTLVPVEVHVISDGSKPPKQLVRDIQSVALALHDVDLDHRIISVVSMPSGAPPASSPSTIGRPTVAGIGVHMSGERLTVDVVLVAADREGEGSSVGTSHPHGRGQLVAAAACQAVERLRDLPRALTVEGVTLTTVGSVRVAVVALTLVSPKSVETLTGSAPCPPGTDDVAVVHAVLDATNRRLGGAPQPEDDGDRPQSGTGSGRPTW